MDCQDFDSTPIYGQIEQEVGLPEFEVHEFGVHSFNLFVGGTFILQESEVRVAETDDELGWGPVVWSGVI